MSEPAMKQRVDDPGKAEQPARWRLVAGVAAAGMFFTAAVLATMTNSAWLAAWVLSLLGALGVLYGVFRPPPQGGGSDIARRAARIFESLALGFSVLFVGASMATGIHRHSLQAYIDVYFAALSGFLAVGFALWHLAAQKAELSIVKVLALCWALLAIALWLAASYCENLGLSFYCAALGLVALLILSQGSFCLRRLWFHAVNCCIFIVLGLLVTNAFLRPDDRISSQASVRNQYQTYQGPGSDPNAFVRWWRVYTREIGEAERALLTPDPSRRLPARLRPNSQFTLFQSRISINSLGFRGKEFTVAKPPGVYRIIAFGESTTFGITLNPGDRPWPEVLEQLIHERLSPERKVEVINAGVPGYDVADGLYRLRTELLKLQPDLLICYHGINGFTMLDRALPATMGASQAPRYRERPLRLLADCEYKLKLLKFRKRQTRNLLQQSPNFIDPMKSPCAAVYRQLCECAATNKIPLVLATFSMAVNRRSSEAAVEFYEGGYPAAPWFVAANEVQSRILKQVTTEFPGTSLLNTAPGLDGVPENFIDLVHFSGEGDRRMAQNVFLGIEGKLKAELGTDAQPTKN